MGIMLKWGLRMPKHQLWRDKDLKCSFWTDWKEPEMNTTPEEPDWGTWSVQEEQGQKLQKGENKGKQNPWRIFFSETKQSPKRLGRPAYTREKAPQQKKCRNCGNLLASKAGCKNHERICKKKELDESKSSCKYCKKTYKVMHLKWIIQAFTLQYPHSPPTLS